MHAFISYSWDSDEHKNWVRRFADELLNNGVAVTLDQYDLVIGQDRFKFMEQSISDADVVLCICTSAYVERANDREKGVGVETMLITPKFFSENPEKQVIPIVRRSDEQQPLTPDYMSSQIFLDFRNDSEFAERMDELLRHVFNKPKHVKPKVGIAPDFRTDDDPMEELLRQILGADADDLLTGKLAEIGVMLNSQTVEELDFYARQGRIRMTSTGSMMNMGARNHVGGHIEEKRRPYGIGQGFILTIAK